MYVSYKMTCLMDPIILGIVCLLVRRIDSEQRLKPFEWPGDEREADFEDAVKDDDVMEDGDDVDNSSGDVAMHSEMAENATASKKLGYGAKAGDEGSNSGSSLWCRGRDEDDLALCLAASRMNWARLSDSRYSS